MSKKEQAALVAFFNTFALTKRITAFDQLWDGKTLFEVGRCRSVAGHSGSELKYR
jgi:hypothetical protein